MRNVLVILFAAALPLAASPIAGGSCGGGTLAQFIALGDAGCRLVDGERIYDIRADLPGSADPSQIVFSTGPSTTPGAEATAHFLPVGALLAISWDAPREIIRAEWYQFDSGGNLSITPVVPSTGVMVLQATIPNAYLGFQLEQIPLPPPSYYKPGDPIGISDPRTGINAVPEPSAFLPLLAIGAGAAALLAWRRKRRTTRYAGAAPSADDPEHDTLRCHTLTPEDREQIKASAATTAP